MDRIDPVHDAEPAEPHAAACGARCRDGSTCGNPPMHGGIKCRMHGGSSPQAKRAAARRLAVAEFAAAFGEIASEAPPHEVILTEIRWTSSHVNWLRQRVIEVVEVDPDTLVWGLDQQVTRGSGEFPGIDLTHAAKTNAWLLLYGQERDRLVRQCEIAIRAGVEARMVELAERAGAVLGDLVDRLLADLDLTPAQHQLAMLRLPGHLRALAASLN